MKLFRSLLLTSSALAFEFTVWDQPDEDGKFKRDCTAFLWPKLFKLIHTYLNTVYTLGKKAR